jgi:hypothetical protein
MEPVAMYFDFPPGTEVYHKERGGKDKAAKETTRIVPGKVEEKDRLKIVEAETVKLKKQLEALLKEKEKLTKEVAEEAKPDPESDHPVVDETESDGDEKPATVTCEICGKYSGSKRQVQMHKISCKG